MNNRTKVILLGVVAITISIIFFVLVTSFASRGMLKSSGGGAALIAALVSFMSATIAAQYLSIRTKNLRDIGQADLKKKNDSAAEDFENLELASLKKQVSELREIVMRASIGDLGKISSEVTAAIVEASTEGILSQLQERLASDDKARQARTIVRSAFSASESRLLTEVNTSSLRASMNMYVGLAISLFGAVVLALAVYSQASIFSDLTQLAINMLPRLSLVVFIEIFAYFFLTMYRSNLAQTRYYQNEITNIELRKVATILAIYDGSVGDVLNALNSTDRNYVFKNSETTHEIERLKIERFATQDALRTVSSLFGKK